MQVHTLEQLLPVARVLADEEGRDALLQDRVEEPHLQLVADREARRATSGPDPHQVLVRRRLQHLDGLDDHRVFQQ